METAQSQRLFVFQACTPQDLASQPRMAASGNIHNPKPIRKPQQTAVNMGHAGMLQPQFATRRTPNQSDQPSDCHLGSRDPAIENLELNPGQGSKLARVGVQGAKILRNGSARTT